MSKLTCVVFVFWIGIATFLNTELASAADDGWISGEASSVNVSGNNGGNSVSCKGSSSYYDLACTGYSWIYYKYVGGDKGKNRPIFFRRDGYLADFGLNGPVDNVISGVCSRHGESGGFWHLGYNMRGMKYSDGIAVFGNWRQVKGLDSLFAHVYSTKENAWGHALTFSYNTIPDYYKENGGEKIYPEGPINHSIWKKIDGEYVEMYRAVKFGSSTGDVEFGSSIGDVLNDYKAAYKSLKGTEYSGASLPSNVYAFCYWEGMDAPEDPPADNLTYYGRSEAEVSAGEVGKSGKTNDYVNSYEEVEVSPITVHKGDRVKLAFSHGVYASQSVNDVKWKVDRLWDFNGNGYSFGAQSDASSSGVVSLNVKNDDDYYASSNMGYVVNDVYENVEFTASGTYNFCETLTIDDNSVTDKPLTKICIEVEVAEYYAESNVSVGDSDDRYSASTGIVGILTDVMTQPTYYAKVRSEVPMAFSHNFYTSAPADNVDWAVKRYLVDNQNRYSVMSDNDSGSDGNGNGDNGTSSSVVEGSVSSTQEVTRNGVKYYWPDVMSVNDGGKPYNDGGTGDTHIFLWRDRYKVTFNKVGDYTKDDKKICERMSVPGSDNDLTGVCASVKVPYNFINTAEVAIASDNLDVGGSIVIEKTEIKVGKKANSAVDDGEYATQVDDAIVELISYVSTNDSSSENPAAVDYGYGSDVDLCSAIRGSESCAILKTKNGLNFNSSNNTDGVTESISEINGSYNIENVDAGEYYCVALAVYPYASGDDTNADDREGSHTWYISAPRCAKVGKKPTFQVWGGSVYSEGLINAYSFERNTSDGKKTFGSWAEQSVVANGKIDEFASGAATSQGSSVSFCKYQVPLTFANYPCDEIGDANISADTSGRDAVISYWWVTNPVADTGDFVKGANANGDTIYYRYSAGNIEIGSKRIDGTYAVYSESGNIYISGDIQYADGPYTSASEIPKLILHAKNIYIACSVVRVDAILVADNKIDTCADASGDNPPINNVRRLNQLTINGVLMAEQVVFNRTYGGGAGEDAAKTPAEIVNYDTSTILWGRGGTESNTDNLFTVVYQQELAPRY